MYEHYNQTQSINHAVSAAREAHLNGPVYDNIRDAHRALSYFYDHAFTDNQSMFWAAVETQDVMGDGRYI